MWSLLSQNLFFLRMAWVIRAETSRFLKINIDENATSTHVRKRVSVQVWLVPWSTALILCSYNLVTSTIHFPDLWAGLISRSTPEYMRLITRSTPLERGDVQLLASRDVWTRMPIVSMLKKRNKFWNLPFVVWNAVIAWTNRPDRRITAQAAQRRRLWCASQDLRHKFFFNFSLKILVGDEKQRKKAHGLTKTGFFFHYLLHGILCVRLSMT